MNKLKRTTAALLALALIMLLGACQSGESGPTAPTAAPTTEPTAQPTAPVTEPTTEPTAPTTEPTTQPTTQPTEPATEPAPTDPVYYPIREWGFTPPPIGGALPESGRVEASWFDDAVFVGDSVSMMLEYYDSAVGALGKAKFLTAGSLGSGNALWEVSDYSVHPTYQGVKMKLEDSVPLTGAKKLFIMLGMNDVGLYGIDGSVANMVTLITNIRSNTPGLTVYVQSMTPLAATSNVRSADGLNNYNIYLYNQKLSDACQAHGWYFVDVGSVMYDEDGFLRGSYCSDPDSMGIHFTYAGCAAWVEYLYTHTA